LGLGKQNIIFLTLKELRRFFDYDRMKEMVKRIQYLCAKYGYTNSLNYPYSGSIVPADYMNDKMVRSIMLEINKRIYLNEETDSLNQEKSEKLKCFLEDFYKHL